PARGVRAQRDVGAAARGRAAQPARARRRVPVQLRALFPRVAQRVPAASRAARAVAPAARTPHRSAQRVAARHLTGPRRAPGYGRATQQRRAVADRRAALGPRRVRAAVADALLARGGRRGGSAARGGPEVGTGAPHARRGTGFARGRGSESGFYGRTLTHRIAA